MSVDISRVRGLLFDIDGTLCDTDNDYVARVGRWLPGALGAHRERLARRFVMALETPGNMAFALLAALELERPMLGLIERIQRASPARAAPDAARVAPVPGTPELLQRLSGRYPMAVVSAGGERRVRAFLEQHDLDRHFQCVATALTCPHTKPYPDPVHWAARQLGVDASACLMIGDTTVDICSGRSAGAQTVGVLCGFGDESELRRYGAHAILASTADLDTLLDR